MEYTNGVIVKTLISVEWDSRECIIYTMSDVLEKYGGRTNLKYYRIGLLLLGALKALKKDNESLSLINHQLRLNLKARSPLWQLGGSHFLQSDPARGWTWSLIIKGAELQIGWVLNSSRSILRGLLVGKNRDHEIWHESIRVRLFENFEILNPHYSLGLTAFNVIIRWSSCGAQREEGVGLQRYEQTWKNGVRILITDIELTHYWLLFLMSMLNMNIWVIHGSLLDFIAQNSLVIFV